jgi:hypothetical protein
MYDQLLYLNSLNESAHMIILILLTFMADREPAVVLDKNFDQEISNLWQTVNQQSLR